MKAYVGTSGWQYKHWNKKFFPADLPKKDWLKYLSRHFDTVEVNTTFYHMARRTTFAKWKSEVGSGFLFSLKMYRLFTHYKKLKLEKKDIETLNAYVKNAALLGNKLGPVLIQFPPSLKKDLELLESFLTKIRKINRRVKLACEFRHASWFGDDAYKMLKKQKTALVITSSPYWPSALVKTADFIYVRFHGETKLFASNYRKQELVKWAEKLRSLKPKTIYAYFNNDANAYAARNALYLKSILN